MQSQVIVIGGGPVGMFLACELAEYGVRTLVVEAENAVSGRPKATTLHARTVQCLVRRGHLGGLLDVGAPGAAGRVSSPFHFAGIPGLAVSAPASEPEPILKCPQDELERSFERRARAAGARILRGHRAVEVRQDTTGVQVTVDGPGGRTHCTADYLVGADGARSTVREQAGITSRTYPATVSAMAGDVRLDDPDALRPGWHRTPRGWIVAKDAPGGVTRLRTLNCEGAHGARHQPLTLGELRREVAYIAGRDIAMTSPRWLSRFSDFSRLADSYRAGRILLAGDAAHLHFPIGGQGLSTGLLDAVGLGWKLAFTVLGTAGEGLLDTYDRERRPAAQRVIDNTRAQLAVMRPDPGLDPLRALFAELLAGGGESALLGAMISAQDTVLPARTAAASPWEGRFLYNVALTTREGRTDVIGLLRAGRPLLLLFGEPGGSRLEQAGERYEQLRVVHAEPVPELACDALLVRPDGYIAWAPGGEDLRSALSAYLGGGTRDGDPVASVSAG
ncbi:FAD-dependent monooxygenase [Streptomyces sp. 15-116A]|uniref:FAD-dependent monooxygenase n=1 Tax=Streptomyces sp. 15-116A TaxID=2259035 RepID=UPI0021B4939B|nr:FAD-dependent monooxygenase [Streptomyces sp. 15-116A]MCT7352789.1 FAD-dependent monooxygenase [Streptomyces sp. 15-116A]